MALSLSLSLSSPLHAAICTASSCSLPERLRRGGPEGCRAVRPLGLLAQPPFDRLDGTRKGAGASQLVGGLRTPYVRPGVLDQQSSFAGDCFPLAHPVPYLLEPRPAGPGRSSSQVSPTPVPSPGGVYHVGIALRSSKVKKAYSAGATARTVLGSGCVYGVSPHQRRPESRREPPALQVPGLYTRRGIHPPSRELHPLGDTSTSHRVILAGRRPGPAPKFLQRAGCCCR